MPGILALACKCAELSTGHLEMVAALLCELGVDVVVGEVGRASELCPEPHKIDGGSVGGQVHGEAGAGQRIAVEQIDAAGRGVNVKAVAYRSSGSALTKPPRWGCPSQWRDRSRL